VDLMDKFNVNPLWLYGESNEKHIDIARGDISPRMLTLDSEGNDNIVLVSQKAAAGYPHNIQDVE